VAVVVVAAFASWKAFGAAVVGIAVGVVVR